MKAEFEHIYAAGIWGRGSGAGSVPRYTRPYRAFLQRFLREKDISSVVDVGCGDWQSSRLIDWTGINYLGLDVAEQVVANNIANFAKAGIRFEATDAHASALPAADLLIIKDVLQHWSNATVKAFLPQLVKFRYALVTNDVASRGPTTSRDIANADYRPIDILASPFNVPGREVLSYSFPQAAERIVRGILGRPLSVSRKVVVLVSRENSP